VGDSLLPALATAADSVELQYYLVEANLILDQPQRACRVLLQMESAARRTPFRNAVANYLADTALGCR
jgi:hypothetical protein